MSSFSVPGIVIEDIEAHPNADALDVIRHGGYRAITQKGRFQRGSRAVYIPEAAVLSEELLKLARFWDEAKGKGMLAGKDGNRVKPMRLRNLFSQGIFADEEVLKHYGVDTIEPGVDYAEILGIVKYQPPIPAHLAGQVISTEFGNFSYTDIENIKRFPNVLHKNEVVYFTEKLHGTCAIYHLEGDQFVVSSKGLAAKGLAIAEDEKNFYWRIAKKFEIEEKLRHTRAWLNRKEALEEQDALPTAGITLFGEGLAVQDLKYGFTGNDATARFFDLRFTDESGEREYTNFGAVTYFLHQMDLPSVPVLYLGVYDDGALAMHTKGKTTLGADHVREGVVIQPQSPRYDNEIGRVILKSISEDYLLRKGEATEYE